GCPYDCNFCSVTEMFGRGYRMQSPEKVMEEVRQHARGRIFFVDDHFAVNKARTNKLVDMMIAEDVRVRWSTQLRTEVTKDAALVEKMKRAGCGVVYIGFESVNPASLIELNKHQSVGDIERTVRVFHDNSINVHGMFMLGSDSDTPEVFKMTADFAKKHGIDFVQYMVLTPLPGTKLYAKLESEGRLLHKEWDYYDGGHAVFQPAHMTPEELQKGMLRCYNSFYSYKNAIKHTLIDTADTVRIALMNMYTDADFKSWFPTVMKFAGRGIVKSWIKQNKHYLEYLKDPWNLRLQPSSIRI
ncbi:MAG: B12-binding domain-containing radical SAM protein, partial [Nanoarchaeota archaeon]|nr:B12-binding domain-containing radical SAM protein [Nanoarchaeota archaeon]